MVLPRAEALTPCLMGRCSPQTRERWKGRYRYAKKYGIRAGFAGVTGTGLVTIVKEAATDGVKRHAKRYIGGILVDSGLTCISGGLPLLTNATKVVKYSKACHAFLVSNLRSNSSIDSRISTSSKPQSIENPIFMVSI